MKRQKLFPATLVIIVMFAFFPLTAIAAPNWAKLPEEPEPECSPKAARLAEWMGVDCSLLMDYQARGIGFGVIWQAYALGQAYPSLNWQDLVASHESEEGLGWGEIKNAYRLAVLLALNFGDLLAKRAEGTGWGEIKQEFREGPGKPPWAGQGPPVWARPDTLP